MSDEVVLESGQVLRTHLAGTCAGEFCCIHNPSDHSMRAFPRYWRGDRGLMERICPHGVGHPDPDHLAVVPERYRKTEAVHGCCGTGCCVGGAS